MQPSAACGGYIVEVTPLERSSTGAYIQTARVLPEYIDSTWYDVLRVGIPAGQPQLDVNVRVYQTCQLPVAAQFDFTFYCGQSIGIAFGAALQDRGYVLELSPLQAMEAQVTSAVVRPEYLSGQWLDVVRVTVPPDSIDLYTHVRIYSTAELDVFAEYETDLQPGEWLTYPLQPSAAKGAFVVELTPLADAQEHEWPQLVVVRPEFDGKRWQDMLSIYSPADQPSLRVQVRVYKVSK
jgi:hypothetical protein